MNNKQLGELGENTAAEILASSGYKILERNYRCKWGEIDIIASKNSNISFIEVKTRRNYNYGRPCEAVNAKKQQHIRNAALCYLGETENRGVIYKQISFDVVEIVIEHIKDAF